MSASVDAQEAVVELRPSLYLEESTKSDTRATTALIILNSPIGDVNSFLTLRSHACYVLCADGGANRLHDLLVGSLVDQDRMIALKRALPDAIHGDLDSLDDAIRQTYESLGVPVTQDKDQYSTDFGKGVNRVIECRPNTRDVLIIGSLGGRVDQGIGLLHELYREQQIRHPGIRFWLFTEASISIVLASGPHLISTPLDKGVLTRNVGILPLYGPAVISTQGLEWDVQEWATEMGGQVSTSNHVVHDNVYIRTNREVLFTIERASNR